MGKLAAYIVTTCFKFQTIGDPDLAGGTLLGRCCRRTQNDKGQDDKGCYCCRSRNMDAALKSSHLQTFPYAGRYPFFCASAWRMYVPCFVAPYQRVPGQW